MTKNKIDTFLEISDLLFYSIEQGNENLARELITFITKVFIEFRKDKEGQEIIYPDEYYATIFQANELICIKPKKTVSYLNGSIFLNLYIDSYQKTIISNKTYNALWVGIRQALEYNRDDIVMSYWENSHQHIGLYLTAIQPELDLKDSKFETLNQDKIDTRDNERNNFFEFHYVLGGLLLYLKKYKLLKNILFYTNQQPPKYHLIPGNLTDIINSLIKIREDYKNPFHYEQIYSFPDINGVNKGAIIRHWTKKYFTVLFLRQYKLHEYYTYQKIFRIPQIPNSLSKMKEWEEELILFKKLINKTINNKDLLASVGLEELSDEDWYKKQNKQQPIKLINEIILSVKKAYKEKKETQSISEEKEKEFYSKSKEILEKSISKFKIIENKNDFSNDFLTYPLTGSCELLDKTAFSADQDISYLNSDTIVAQTVSANLELKITGSFSAFIKKRYLFKPEDIFNAIKRLVNNTNDYHIISFGVNIKYYIDFLKIEGFKEVDNKLYFNSIKIINIETYINPNLTNSLIVINKNDLPKFIYNDISKEDKERYNITADNLLEKKYFIYGRLIDLNKEDKTRDTISLTNIDDLKKKVLSCILLNWEVKWEKSSEIYQFNVYQQFRNSGKSNSIEDVIILKNDKE